MGVLVCLLIGVFLPWNGGALVFGVVLSVVAGIFLLGPAPVLILLDIAGGGLAFVLGSSLNWLFTRRRRARERELLAKLRAGGSTRFSLGDGDHPAN